MKSSLICLYLCSSIFPLAAQAELRRAFERPPDDARILMRWWWFGPAVTAQGLEREMRRMKEGGIGGFEVQPVYPLALDDEAAGIRNLRYLSPEFLEMLRFTGSKARELGLRMDLTLGSGWPYGGPQVPAAQAAARLRLERVRGETRRVAVPYRSPEERLIAAFAGPAQRQVAASEIRDGVLWLPEAGQEVMFFFSSRTGQMVKRAAFAAEGFVHDHYDRAALDNYLRQVGEPQLRALAGALPYAIFCDSLEVYGNDWTGDFPAEFQKRRGYDLTPHLPKLAGTGSEALGVRQDWGRTMTELLEERFLAPLQQWAKQKGTRLRTQVYGTPPATLSSNALVDLPEGEGVQWKSLSSTRWATSAGHLFERPVISSETWTWLHSPVFRATPLDLKAEADLHFLQGINQLIGHGWPYTPESVEYPGWRFYAAGVYNEKNPWWHAMPDIALYLQRVSHMLRQGRPANDVAFYLPVADGWAHLRLGEVDLIRSLRERLGPEIVAKVLEAGYGLDFFDDRAIAQAMRHRMIVLPALETIPLDTLRKLEQFARNGGILVAARKAPERAPGFRATEAEHRAVRDIWQRLFAGPAHFVAEEKELPGRLNTLLAPDVAFSPAAPDVGFLHRRADNAEIYFVANTGANRQALKAKFRVTGMSAEFWDPLTGKQVPASPTAEVDLDLPPYGSTFVVFSRGGAAEPPRRTAAAQGMDISAGWTVRFGERGQPQVMETLTSWTDAEETRYFSGTAVYEKEVAVPATLLAAGAEVRLEFGEGRPRARTPGMGYQALLDAPVREAAVVYVNGKRAGAVWCPPYALEVTGYLRPGPNALRIVVGNLAVNHMAGRRMPDYRLLNLRFTERFQAQDMDKIRPEPAGLLGPIRLEAR